MDKAAVKSDNSAVSVKAVANQIKPVHSEEQTFNEVPQIQFKFTEKDSALMSVAQSEITIRQFNDKYKKQPDVQRKIEKPVNFPLILRQPQEEEEEEEFLQTSMIVQTQPDREEEEIQKRPAADSIFGYIQKKDTEEEELIQTGMMIQTKSEDEEEEPVQAKKNVSQSNTILPDFKRSLQSISGGGKPLDPATRQYFEPRFGSGFDDVRIHTSKEASETAESINAQAYTFGNNIVFGPGYYSPESNSGKRLLAHELTHVIQQNRAQSFQPHFSNATDKISKTDKLSIIQRTPQHRLSLDTEWYVEMEPASSIVPVGTEVTFRLKNSGNAHFAVWERVNGDNGPVIGVRVRGGETHTWVPRSPRYPMTLRRRFTRPGHVEIFFRGRPIQGAGPADRPMAMTITGSAIYVSVELDIVEHLTRESVEAESSQATYREDINRLEDPDASGPEIAQAFQRIAVRRGIDIINRNKQEAWDLLQMYTAGVSGRSGSQAMTELRSVLSLNQQLEQQISRLRSLPREGMRVAQQAGVEIRNREEYRNFTMRKIREINLVRASLIDAFPAMALSMGSGPLATTVRRGTIDQSQQALQTLLNRVLRDCDTTRNGLTTEDLHIFDVPRVITEVRQTLGIDADTRKRHAVDEAIRRHRRSSLAQSLGLAGAAIVLLFIPGLGPYLAAAVGLTAAGISWERAGDLMAAAGAGVREGIVAGAEAGAAVFWAAIETLLAGLDVAVAVRSLTRIVPHVPAATDRLVPVARSAGTRVAPRATASLPGTATAGSEAGGQLSLTADELSQLCAQLFRRPVTSMRGFLHYYNTIDEFADAVQAASRRQGGTISREAARRPLGFHAEGHVHISPRAGLLTHIHEMIHRVAHEIFPMGNQLLGRYLNEGITEHLTRQLLGPRASRHGYDQNVVFVTMLERRVGQTVVRNSVLHGRYSALRNAVKQALGGSEARTFEFFTLLRRGDRDSIRRASQMLATMSRL